MQSWRLLQQRLIYKKRKLDRKLSNLAEIGSKTELKISEIKERKRKSLFNTSSCLEKKSKLNPTFHKLSKKKKNY